jgi:hypothetical protein
MSESIDEFLRREFHVHRTLHRIREIRREVSANPGECNGEGEFARRLEQRGIDPHFIPSPTTMSITQLRGYQRWVAMNHMFATQSFLVPLDYQIRFRTAMMQTLLPLVYSENGEWARYRDMICAHHLEEGEPYMQYAAMICARQVGKSTIVANVLLALVLHVPNLDIMVISIAARQSGLLGRTLFEQMALTIGDQMGRFVVRRSEEICKFANGSSIFFAPARATSVRGVRISCLIADEACFMRDEDANVTVLPFTSIENVPMVFLSSPNSRENFVNRIMEYRDPVSKQPRCHTVHVQQVCRACAGDGLIACDHVAGADPPWKASTQNSGFQAAIYGGSSAGNYELGGIMDVTKRPAFEPTILAALRDSIDVELTGPPIAAILAIDPCGGGRQSDCGVVILALVEDPPGSPTPGKLRMLVLGGATIELETGTNQTVYRVVSMLVRYMRESRFMGNTTIALVVESNLSALGAMQTVNHIAKIGDPNIVAMSETRISSNGERVMGPYVYLDGARGKERYVQMADAMLRTETLRFATNMFVVSSREQPTEADLASARRLFRMRIVEQMYGFSVTTTPRANGTAAKVFSGKSSSGTHKDDLAMALMMAIWQLTIYVSLDSYTQVRGCRPIDILAVQRGAHDAFVALAHDARAEDLANGVIRRPWDPMHPDARSDRRTIER